MDRNQVEIQLLKRNPEKLLLGYQSMIRTIVRVQSSKGLVKWGDIDDLVQEINKKLLERLPRIQDQFNNTSQLRTYFSKIILNICLEEVRKSNQLMEPLPEPYGGSEIADEPVDSFLFRQEYERFRRIIVMLALKGQKLLLLLKIINDLPVSRKDIIEYNYHVKPEIIERLVSDLNASQGKMKKEKFSIFGDVMCLIEGKRVPSDSLRKWYKSHLNECLDLMNGNPPSRSFTEESLGILLEKNVERKNL